MNENTPGSMSPDRVPMTRPARGVRPMDVSMLRPPEMAAALAPLPRCSTTSFGVLDRLLRARRPLGGSRRRRTCRGSRSGAPDAPRARTSGRRRCRSAPAWRGGRRCRRRRPVARPGSVSMATRMPSRLRRVVQRRQGFQLLDGRHDVLGDDDRVAEPVTAVHDPVPDGQQARRGRGSARSLRGTRRATHRPARSRCVGDADRSLQRVPSAVRAVEGFVPRLGLALADPLDAALGERGLRGGVDQLVLQRRRPGVDHEDRSRASVGAVTTSPRPGSP